MLVFDQIDTESFRPLCRDEYYRLWELGAFENERVELLEGVVVKMSPQGPPHAFTVQRLTKLLIRALGDRADLRPQLPLVVSSISEPEPDLAVVPPEEYLAEHPDTAWLVIEVAYSSLVTDLRLKARLYALANIPEYWVVHLQQGRLIVHRDPGPEGYRSVQDVSRGERIHLVALPDVALDVAAFLPDPV